MAKTRVVKKVKPITFEKYYAMSNKVFKMVNSKSTKSLNKEQVVALVDYINKAINTRGKSVGTYRWLIYDNVGIGYCDGMDMKLLELNNALCGLKEVKQNVRKK